MVLYLRRLTSYPSAWPCKSMPPTCPTIGRTRSLRLWCLPYVNKHAAIQKCQFRRNTFCIEVAQRTIWSDGGGVQSNFSKHSSGGVDNNWPGKSQVGYSGFLGKLEYTLNINMQGLIVIYPLITGTALPTSNIIYSITHSGNHQLGSYLAQLKALSLLQLINLRSWGRCSWVVSIECPCDVPSNKMMMLQLLINILVIYILKNIMVTILYILMVTV